MIFINNDKRNFGYSIDIKYKGKIVIQKNEIILNDIIEYFEYLVINNVTLIDAYSLTAEKFGEEELIKHLLEDESKNLI